MKYATADSKPPATLLSADSAPVAGDRFHAPYDANRAIGSATWGL